MKAMPDKHSHNVLFVTFVFYHGKLFEDFWLASVFNTILIESLALLKEEICIQNTSIKPATVHCTYSKTVRTG